MERCQNHDLLEIQPNAASIRGPQLTELLLRLQVRQISEWDWMAREIASRKDKNIMHMRRGGVRSVSELALPWLNELELPSIS